MLVQVENTLDDAHVLVGGQTYANRQQVGEILLAVLSRLSVTALLAILALASRTRCLVGRLVIVGSTSSFAAILAGSRVLALLTSASRLLLLLGGAGGGRVSG